MAGYSGCMRHAADTWRLVRLIAVAVTLLTAGCASTGGFDDATEQSLSYRAVFRTDRSGPPVGGAGPKFANLTFGERLRVPEMRVVHVPGGRSGRTVRRARSGTAMEAPVSGAVVTSYFGVREHPILGDRRLHEGIDLGVPAGTPIRAPSDGVVEYAAWNGGYGKFVSLRHDARYSTAYAHMSRIAEGIEEGMTVSRGEVIGYVGSTGRSTGPHLHFELHDHGQPIDPLEVMPLETVVALASE